MLRKVRVQLPLASIVLTSVLATSGLAQDTNARVLLVSVADNRGNSVIDFSVDDFVVNEGSREREVLDVHIADYPVGLVIDDGAPASQWPELRAAAARFITRVGERPVAIAALSNVTPLISELDVDRAALLSRLDAFTPRRPVAPSALAAIADMSRQLKATESPFSAIVVIAAGPVNAGDPVRGELLPVIVDSGATVHVVAAHRMAAAGQTDTGDLLQVLADQTHGQYTTIFAAPSYAVALDRLADRLAAEMMVQYLVPPGERTDDVKVGVRRPGARVLGRGVSK